jgi:hypothetical protein
VAAACALVVLLQVSKTYFAHLQVVVVAGGFVQKVGKFNEHGSQVNLKWSYVHGNKLNA